MTPFAIITTTHVIWILTGLVILLLGYAITITGKHSELSQANIMHQAFIEQCAEDYIRQNLASLKVDTHGLAIPTDQFLTGFVDYVNSEFNKYLNTINQ